MKIQSILSVGAGLLLLMASVTGCNREESKNPSADAASVAASTGTSVHTAPAGGRAGDDHADGKHDERRRQNKRHQSQNHRGRHPDGSPHHRSNQDGKAEKGVLFLGGGHVVHRLVGFEGSGRPVL